MRSVRGRSALGLLGTGRVVVIAGVHFEQYADFMSEVPTVGVLFLLNAAGGAGLVVAPWSAEYSWPRLLAAIESIGLAACFSGLDRDRASGSFFGYSEPTLRLPILIAIVAEAIVIPRCS